METRVWVPPRSPPCHVLCPLAGGSGAVAKACMSLYPGSQITVFDILDVVQMAKRHFSFPEDERIGLCEGGFPSAVYVHGETDASRGGVGEGGSGWSEWVPSPSKYTSPQPRTVSHDRWKTLGGYIVFLQLILS